MENKVEVFTDGSSRGNPGPGGYGIVLKFGDKEKEVSKGFRLTTNNRMELLAVIEALSLIKSNHYPIHVYSDSKYVIESITQKWVWNWEKKGFKEKKNADLWIKYLALHPRFNLHYHWVKGHAGHPQNERCDAMAVEAALSSNLSIDAGYETTLL